MSSGPMVSSSSCALVAVCWCQWGRRGLLRHGFSPSGFEGKEKRRCAVATHILIHQLRTAFWGKYEELLDEVNNSKLLMDAIVKVYKKETTIQHKSLGELLKKELNLSTEKCITYGLVRGLLHS